MENQKLKMTILGGRGMLGTDLAEEACSRGFSVTVCDLPEFDLTDPEHIRRVGCAHADAGGRSFIVNCAAYTNVEKAESEIELANQVNGYAVGRLGQFAARENVPVLHISTDFVFDGKSDTPYTETNTVNPISVYGSSKLLGEKLLAESGCRYAILRVQWTYGKHGTNFITKITGAAKTRDELKVVDDQVGSPTHTAEVAKIICDMLAMETFPEGLYHCAANGYVSRYDMTRYLFDHLGIQTKVLPCKTADFKTAAQRPLNSRFDCTKLENLIGRPLPTWQAMLDNYLKSNP